MLRTELTWADCVFVVTFTISRLSIWWYNGVYVYDCLVCLCASLIHHIPPHRARFMVALWSAARQYMRFGFGIGFLHIDLSKCVLVSVRACGKFIHATNSRCEHNIVRTHSCVHLWTHFEWWPSSEHDNNVRDMAEESIRKQKVSLVSTINSPQNTHTQ